MWHDLEGKALPLIVIIKSALSECIFRPGDSVSDLMDGIPIDTCARLASVLSDAAAMGVSADLLAARFGPEERFIIELVASLFAPYGPSVPGRPDPAILGRLLDPAAVTPPPL
jgi:hypothetical protein